MMKKLSGAAAVLAALMMLFVAGCEQASGGGESSGGGETPAEETITLAGTTWEVKSADPANMGAFVKNAKFEAETWSVATADAMIEKVGPVLASGSYTDNATIGNMFPAPVDNVMGNPNAEGEGHVPDAEITVVDANTLTVKITIGTLMTFTFTKAQN